MLQLHHLTPILRIGHQKANGMAFKHKKEGFPKWGYCYKPIVAVLTDQFILGLLTPRH